MPKSNTKTKIIFFHIVVCDIQIAMNCDHNTMFKKCQLTINFQNINWLYYITEDARWLDPYTPNIAWFLLSILLRGSISIGTIRDESTIWHRAIIMRFWNNAFEACSSTNFHLLRITRRALLLKEESIFEQQEYPIKMMARYIFHP